jgi:CheY-like chemotaxis protein
MNACRFVLVVDDDPAMQKVLSLGIKRMGHDVAVARNRRGLLARHRRGR